MLLLALDTATTTCSAALLRDDRVLAEVHLHLPRVHAQHLTPLVDDLLTRTEQAPADVDAVAVSMGPGSYTGLRIGVSTAKGWALAHDAALVGVPTLEALAAQVRPWGRPGDVVCALLDARRDDVYAAAYRLPPSPEETLDLHAGPEALDVADVPTTLRLPADAGTVWLLGDGTSKADPPSAPTAPDRSALFPPSTHVPPPCGSAAVLASACLATRRTTWPCLNRCT